MEITYKTQIPYHQPITQNLMVISRLCSLNNSHFRSISSGSPKQLYVAVIRPGNCPVRNLNSFVVLCEVCDFVRNTQIHIILQYFLHIGNDDPTYYIRPSRVMVHFHQENLLGTITHHHTLTLGDG